ncbi:MAG: sigma-70 family RNA polymerase sigma factor [Planctomycetota bacterium]
MKTGSSGLPPDPLRDDSPETWERLVEGLAPATLLVCIAERMAPRLRARFSPEDIWQDTLLQVWRDRSSCEWRGPAAFRRWVLAVAENRIRNAADRLNAAKRDAAAELPLERADAGDDPGPPPAVSSTTPSRVAGYREESEAMRAALGELTPDVREVVRLRLFEELPVEEVAERLSLGSSAVKHRFRRGVHRYQALLSARLASTRGRADAP